MMKKVPLRVDFAGGWLDIPSFSRAGGFVVNCAIKPFMTLKNNAFAKGGGLGGSAAWSLLNDKDPYRFDAAQGCGWQDPAVIIETGLCVWKSGNKPDLHYKDSGRLLSGKMAIYATGMSHETKKLVAKERDYNKIFEASKIAARAVMTKDLSALARAISLTYSAQLEEGMSKLPPVNGAIAYKYCGGGHGGYALYLFRSKLERDFVIKNNPRFLAIEPYCKRVKNKKSS